MCKKYRNIVNITCIIITIILILIFFIELSIINKNKHYCPACNTELNNKFKFCPGCGMEIDSI